MNATESTPAVKPERKPRKPRKKLERPIRILEQPTTDTDGWGAIAITIGKQTDTYLVHFIPSDFGNGAIGLEVEKLNADLATIENYHVHLSDRPEECSCTCPHATYRPHAAPCRHIAGLKALDQAGKFPRLYTARDARRDPESQEPPELNECEYFDPAELDDPA